MELQELYDQLISAGCNQFYIEGIGGPQTDDVVCLGSTGENWQVYYTERGQKEDPMFSSADKNEAIKYYLDFILKIEHWHLIVMTRSEEIFLSHKDKLGKIGLNSIQNDIPDYKHVGDKVFRLFVTNKDIFTAKEQLGV
jgi:hypothetical protein